MFLVNNDLAIRIDIKAPEARYSCFHAQHRVLLAALIVPAKSVSNYAWRILKHARAEPDDGGVQTRVGTRRVCRATDCEQNYRRSLNQANWKRRLLAHQTSYYRAP